MDLAAHRTAPLADRARLSRAAHIDVPGAGSQLERSPVTGPAADWYGNGVASVRRWIAEAAGAVGTNATAAPVSERALRATPELVEEERAEAERLMRLRSVPGWQADRPGWLDGVLATLEWAARGGPPPLDLQASGADDVITPPA